MKITQFFRLALLPWLASACDKPLEPGSKVDSFRVLAEQVDQPFAHPGETVQLSSLSFDPEGRDVTWAWASCVNPDDNTLEGCVSKLNESQDPSSAVFAVGAGMDAPQLTIPDDALEHVSPQVLGAASVGIVSVACPGDLSIGDGPGGLPFNCQDTGTGLAMALDEFIAGIKRITVRQSDRNQNPKIGSVTFDGVDWPENEVKTVGSCDRSDFDYASCPAANKHQLAVVLTPDSFESGKDELGRDFDEALIVQYYATEGIFEDEIKTSHESKNGWVARKSASGQTLTLWFVARDDRGGVSWTQRQVTVQ